MKFYKYKNIIFSSINNLVTSSLSKVFALVDGQLNPIDQFTDWANVEGVVVVPNDNELEEATLQDYLVYRSLKNNLVKRLSREDQQAIESLNKSSFNDLTLGRSFNDKGFSGLINTVDKKLRVISMTQHISRSDVPTIDDTNKVWARWIVNTRAIEPFVFITNLDDVEL